MPAVCFVNDVDLATLGFKGLRVLGLSSTPQHQPALGSIPGRAGQLLLANKGGQLAPRVVSIIGLLKGTQLTQESARQKLYAIAGAGLCELRDNQATSKVAFGFLEQAEAQAYDPQYIDPANDSITFRFRCPDPWRYDRSPTLVWFSTTRGTLQLGTAPVAPVVRILGAVNNPTLTLRSAAGFSRCVMGFTINLGANDYLEVDADACTVVKSVAGVVSNALDTWTTFTDGFPVLDPFDGDPLNGAWSTFEVSGGNGYAQYSRSWQ